MQPRPQRVGRAERVLGRLEDATARGFMLDPESVQDIGRAEARRSRWGTAALWILAACAAIVTLRGIW